MTRINALDTYPGQPTQKAGPRRLARARTAVTRRLRRAGFGVRLFLALGVALLLVGAAGHELISQELNQHQIDAYAGIQRADARAIEATGERVTTQGALREIGQLINAIGERPGADEVLLIGPDNVIRASADPNVIGHHESDSRINAALVSGGSYAGREVDPREDARDFAFVTPVYLGGAPYALETTFGHASFDAQLAGVRRILILVGLIGLVGVSAIFYLIGGRSLLRSHGFALRRATRDGLTDLPNLRAFSEELDRAVALGGRHQDPLSLAVLDIDHFKLINDRHGHPQGDAVLKRVAAVLRDGRTADRAFRLGGDEFALLLAGTDAEGVSTTVRRLSRTLSEAGITVSIGVATMRDGQLPDELRAEADAALYEGKRRGGGGFVGFEEIREQVIVTTASKREAVRRLIEGRLLSTAYQPIWNLGSRELLGIEALMRPDALLGLSGPAEAFDVAEKIGRAHELDQVAVEIALSRVSELPEEALLFINLCPKTLELDARGDGWFSEAVGRAGLANERVVVEVTERLGARIGHVAESLQRLRTEGFKIALDDVGTGNAGLEMLRKIDAEFVKIDRSIVSAAAVEPNARAVLTAMASFASETGAFVIAEGVEDRETLEFLRAVRPLDHEPVAIIQGGQGYELGRPSTEFPASDRAALNRRARAEARRPLRRSPAARSPDRS